MIFVKPNGKVKQYGNLKSISAIEPPVWLACLASHYKGSSILDAEVMELTLGEIRDVVNPNEPIIIFPTGSNAFGFFQQQEAARELEQYLLNSGIENVEVWEQLKIDPTNITINWDLLKVDQYRTPNWHGWGRKNRKYGATFTSINCPYKCNFCSIKDFYSSKFKARDLQLAVNDIYELYTRHGISNFKLMDEMFVFNHVHVKSFCNLLKSKGISDDLNIWAYARIDTVGCELLKLMKSAGIRWVSYGIESGNEGIRKMCGKGKFTNDDIRDIIKMTHDIGLSIIGNYIFGFKEDNISTMEQTFELAQELQCEYSNFYCYVDYNKKRKSMTETAQYSPDFKPESTNYLMAQEVVRFRDKSFVDYYTDPSYLKMIGMKFGYKAVLDIQEMTKIKVVRNENY